MRLSSSFGLLASTALLSACSSLFPGGGDPQPPAIDWVVHNVRVDSVGYATGRSKVATVILPAGLTALSDTTAEVFDLNGNLQWACQVTGPFSDADLGITYYFADFTPFDGPGTFYIAVPALGTDETAQSAPFQIGPGVFAGALESAMTGMYGQRCGTAVKITMAGDTWQHAACHLHDADSLKYLTGVDQPFASTGGWHDAGDYGKYTTNGAFSAGMMLAAWEQFQPAVSMLSLPIPEHGGVFPDFLAEVKWELDWLLTIPSPDGSGGIPHKLTALNFEGFIMPETDMSTRYFTPVGTAATADFVAVMAEAARIYQPYDADFAAKCLAAARLSYGFLQANTGPVVPSTPDFSTGGYGDSNDSDERTWAAAELWETTGEADFLTDFETRAARGQLSPTFDWQNVGNLGMFTYLLSKRDGRNATLVASLSSSLNTTAEQLVRLATTNSWGRPMGYSWGANGAVARTAMNLATANALTPDARYVNAIGSGLDHLLGRNHYDRSQITMVGNNPPLHPHHRPSASDTVVDPWPGLLVGGQDCPSGASNCSTAPKYDWQDTQSAPNLNEIAVNWNGALVYAAAAMASQAITP